MNPLRSRLEQSLGWIVLALLLAGCLWVIKPFFTALLWAVVLCCSGWPLYCRLLKLVGNRRTLASFLMLLGMFLIMLLPVLVVGMTLADNAEDLRIAVQKWFNDGPPAAPAWLAKLPLVGANLAESWRSLASDSGKLMDQLKAWLQPMLRGGLVLGQGILELVLSTFIAFFFFRDGVSLAERLSTAVGRISGEQGRRLLTVAGKTVRGVVYGILGTALIQAVLSGIGFLIAGVPGAALLALLTFFFSVVPVIGTGLVWIPAALWLFHQGSTGWGIFMLIWGLAVGNVDNVVKPWLISQGSEMPFILIFFGVLGGALTFGFIGVFLGPTLLAVGYRLVAEWASINRVASDSANTEPESETVELP